MTKPLILCIMDGVGIAPAGPHNAVTTAKTPTLHKLWAKYPHTQLNASGAAVGLLPGVMGNSEVGHITMGAGRIANQFLRRFQIEDESGALPHNPALTTFINDVRTAGGIVHMIGMVSDGRVHSDIAQEIAVLKIILAAGLRVCIHFIADGRDTPPESAGKYAGELCDTFATEITAGTLWFGSVSGRYYAMDRNNNWDREQLAFDAIVRGTAEYTAPDIRAAISCAYARGESDEFIRPTVIAAHTITAADGVLFTNYRSDRARMILKMITGIAPAPAAPVTTNILCFSQYGEGLDELCPALLPDIPIKNTLGDVLAAAGMAQLRIAETEKYNHVTFFFDAERTIDFPNEEKVLIPSPSVATFDMKPEMSAREITDALLPRMAGFNAVILNFANGDMVGHTGNMDAAVRAMETVDECLARLVPAALALDGTVLITADHGNAEEMWDDINNVPKTSHTTNPVPFIVVSNAPVAELHSGGLSNIAPTMLKLLGITKPTEMTGESLL